MCAKLSSTEAVRGVARGLFRRFPLVIANYTFQATTAGLSAPGSPPNWSGTTGSWQPYLLTSSVSGLFILNETPAQLLDELPTSLKQIILWNRQQPHGGAHQ